jgi:alpha-galactosidase
MVLRGPTATALLLALTLAPVFSFESSDTEVGPPPLDPNGLALTPPLGWHAAKADPQTARSLADALVSTGLRQAGYTYVVLGDGWQDAPDWKEPAAYLHANGLRLGLTAAAEETSCTGGPGLAGREEIFARRFAQWGLDYLEYEWCAGRLQPASRVRAGARKMAAALRASGRAVVFSLVPRGVRNPELWAAADGANAWRVGPDLDGSWESLSAVFDLPVELDGFAAPGRWNQLDAMPCGSGLTPAEYRSQLTLRALLATPLFLSGDPRALPAPERELLTNADLLAIHQDRLGRAGRKTQKWLDHEVWSRPLAGGAWALGLFNRGRYPQTIRISIAALDFRFGAKVRDVWKRKYLGRFDDEFSATVEPHGVVLVRLDP